MAKAKPPVPEKLAPIAYGKCPTLEHGNRVFAPRVERLLTPEQIEDPKLWEMVAAKLEKNSYLFIHAEDGSFAATAFVLHALGSQVRVKVTSYNVFEKVEQKELELAGYVIRNLGGPEGWSIVDKKSGELLKGNMPDQASCVMHIQDTQRVLSK
jgi:hypothetical protein